MANVFANWKLSDVEAYNAKVEAHRRGVPVIIHKRDPEPMPAPARKPQRVRQAHGPKLNKLETEATQLDSNYGQARNHGIFRRMPTQEQLGALNAIQANNTTAKVQSLMKTAESRASDMRGYNLDAYSALAKKLERAYRLGLNEKYFPSVDTYEPALREINSLIGDIAGSIEVARPVGWDSLRRAGIVNDMLTPGPKVTPQDLTPWMTEGLARAKGGRIPPPRTHAGPLTQCACGAK